MFCPFVSEDIVSYISKARSVWYFTWNSFILKSIVQSYNGDMTHIYKSGVIYFYLVEKVYILPISGVIWDQMILQNEMCLSAIMLWVHVIDQPDQIAASPASQACVPKYIATIAVCEINQNSIMLFAYNHCSPIQCSSTVPISLQIYRLCHCATLVEICSIRHREKLWVYTTSPMKSYSETCL